MLTFERDSEKARENERKHGVAFAEVFCDDRSSSVPDPDHSVDEDRYVIFGMTKQGRPLLCPTLSAKAASADFGTTDDAT